MSYAGLQMFMNKLKQLIYCTENPLINNPAIICERAQFLKLYEELDSMIQMLFIHEDQDLEMFEKVRIQRRRYKAAAEEAEDIVDLFLSTVHFRKNGYFPRSDVFHLSLHLEVVMISMKSIRVELMTMFMDNMKMDSSLKTDRLQIQSAGAGTSRTRNSRGSKKVYEEIIVGLDRDVELIRDELVKDRKQLNVVCIVGMGGIGKTTLASIVFNDPFVRSYFYVRAWVTVSQTYENRDLLIQILSSMGVQLELEKPNEYQLREMLHKSLKGNRYLIVIDDIWSIKAWDKLKLSFPDDNTGSRILFTSRLTEIAWHVKIDGFIHQLQNLTEKESWELLCHKVFQNDECPDWLIEPGKQIAKDCHGLPFSLVVIAGVLTKEAKTKSSWAEVAVGVRSYITGDEAGCLESLALSYDHLPLHLRECFLYLGGFPEDSLILVKRLTWLWMGEGFIQEDGSQSLEEIAEDYLIDLVDRNLVIIIERKYNGKVTVCKVHDLVRELCLEKSKEERFFLRIDGTLPFRLQEAYHKKLLLKYHRLPLLLRKCFLSLGRFRYNSWRLVRWLIRLWMDEGFIQEDGTRCLEEIAEGYLVDLVDTHLLLVGKGNELFMGIRLYGDERFCVVNTGAWDQCVEKANEQRISFSIKDWLSFNVPNEGINVITTYDKPHTMSGTQILFSYIRLPSPLKECFLSLASFLENSWRLVQSMMWLWMDTGLIQDDETQCLEEIAEGYLMDLVDSDLVIVTERMDLVGRNCLYGDVRICKVNDLAWNLCVEKAKEESLISSEMDWAPPSLPAEESTPVEVRTTYKPRRVFAYQEVYIANYVHPPTPSMRSLSCFHSEIASIYDIIEYFRSFALLRVLNLPNCILIDFPLGIALLVHLRYLSINHSLFPSSICNLWNLQTLIVTTSYNSMVVPSNISNLVNLRHFRSNTELYLPSIRDPMNLQTISNVVLGDEVENFQKCFPIIKKLACTRYFDSENDFEILHNLETLKLTGLGSRIRESIEPEFLPNCGMNDIKFPATLKKLTLVRCRLPWSDMSIIQSLPNLESLRLLDNAFEGILWETGEDEFQQLQFLTLDGLNIRHWEAVTMNFPCLILLQVVECKDLEEIPLELGDISTLGILKADGCGASLNASLEKIQQEQDYSGNSDLMIIVDGSQLHSFVPELED